MTPKIAYLTIDDAPTNHVAQKVDWLAAENIPAIFFCIGQLMEQNPQPVISAIQRGFVVGNHTYDHPHCSAIPLADVLAQIERTDAIVEEIYRRAGVPCPAKLFRFPYGDKGALTGDDVFVRPSAEGAERKATIQQKLRQLGYMQPAFPGITYSYYRAAGLLADVDWYWTYDTLDWSIFSDTPILGITSVAAALARMDEDEPQNGRGLNTPGSEEIVLIHDHEASTDAFPILVRRLREKGCDFRLPFFIE
jgi:peptidoglycan/xylan/chitin deacetylase (PgdA/CDA1 family)